MAETIIRQRMANIENVLRELNIDYKITGDEAIACCPAHDDKHPSWSVNLKNGVHYCFACGFKGSLAGLVAYMLRYNYQEAVLWLNARLGWLKATQWWEENEDNTSYSPAYMKIGEAELALFTFPPDDALESRRITAESAAKYDVMWNPERQSWIFTIRDPYNNDLWGWQEKNDRIFRNFPSGVRKSETLFGSGTFVHDSTLSLVESPIDCVRLDAVGISGGLSGYGVQISNKQLSVIQRITEHLVLALDNDRAGISETARICREFSGVKSIHVFNYGLSGGKDPGELSEGEIRFGFENKISSIRWLKTYDAVQRHITSLPKGTSSAISLTEELASRLLNGTWQNGNRNSGG